MFYNTNMGFSHSLHFAVHFQFDCFQTFQAVVVNHFYGYMVHPCLETGGLPACFVDHNVGFEALTGIVIEIPSVKFYASFAQAGCDNFYFANTFCLGNKLLFRLIRSLAPAIYFD